MAAASARAEDAPGCAKFKWSIERERTAFAAGNLPVLASGAALPGPGSAAMVTLQPQAGVAFLHAPARKPKVDPAFAAVLTMPAPPTAGTYEVTVSAEAWVDVLQDGKEIKSAGFSGQPDCPGVRKSVKFPLAAAPVTIQISGSSADAINLDVLPVR